MTSTAMTVIPTPNVNTKINRCLNGNWIRVNRGMGMHKMAISVEMLNGEEASEVMKILVHVSLGWTFK